MKKIRFLLGLVVLLSLLVAPHAMAQKREKFGIDKRHEETRRVKVETSNKTFRWKMVTPWSKGILWHDFAQHFADSVRLASGGRLDIRVFSAGELVGAMEIFDAVSKGSAEVMHDWPGYWKGKNEAFPAYASVPFGLDDEGYNIWLYERGGLDMATELYGRYGMIPFPCGQSGQEMGLFSNKKATSMEDYKGMRLRTVGWYMDIMSHLGASVSPLPGGEVYLALERGVIDAAEFSTPALNYPLGFDDITKYVISPGVHQPAIQNMVVFNKKAWDSLPADLQWIVKIAAAETQLWTKAWIENLNAEALNLMKGKVEFITMDEQTLNEFAKTTKNYLDDLKAKHPDVKKALDSQEQFKRDFADWREQRGRVAPWPIEDYIKGKHVQ